MATITFDLDQPDRGPAVGWISFTPDRRRVDGGTVVVESPPISVHITGDVITHEIPAGYWRVTERVGKGMTRFVLITGDADYATLPDIDPATLDPEVEPAAAWDLRVDGIETRVEQLEADTEGGGPVGIGDVTGLQGALTAHDTAISALAGADAVLADEISTTQTTLAGKADATHTHTAAQVTDLTAAVDAQIAGKRGTAGGIASLGVDGKVPASQLPPSGGGGGGGEISPDGFTAHDPDTGFGVEHTSQSMGLTGDIGQLAAGPGGLEMTSSAGQSVVINGAGLTISGGGDIPTMSLTPTGIEATTWGGGATSLSFPFGVAGTLATEESVSNSIGQLYASVGQPYGPAGLDMTGHLPIEQLPDLVTVGMATDIGALYATRLAGEILWHGSAPTLASAGLLVRFGGPDGPTLTFWDGAVETPFI